MSLKEDRTFLESTSEKNKIKNDLKRNKVSRSKKTNFEQQFDISSQSKTNILNLYQNLHFYKSFKHSNILNLLKGRCYKNNVFLTFENIEMNLETLLKYNNHLLSKKRIKKIFYQLVLGVFYLHSKNTEHLNLLPENIFFNDELNVKIAGFTNAKPLFFPKDTNPVEINQTLFTAPEIVLNNKDNLNTSFKSDIWSLGCLFFVLLSNNNVFSIKDHYLKILNLLMKLIGKPFDKNLSFIKNESALEWIKQQPNYVQKMPSMYLRNLDIDSEAKNLLDSMLKFDPRDRPSCEEILKHSYFSTILNEDDYDLGNNQLNPKDFELVHSKKYNKTNIISCLEHLLKSY